MERESRTNLPALYTVATTHPRGVGPVVARPATRRRAIAAVVTRCGTHRRAIYAVVARTAPVVARSYTRCWALHTCCRPFFFKLPYPSSRVAEPLSPAVDSSSRAANPSTGTADPSSRATYPSSRGADPLSQPFSHPPCTRSRAPYKYARVLLFPRTLSEHPGLHLPRRLLAGFFKGCFTFFIARHPPRLEFREYSAIHSALVNLDYIEIKHYFFFSLGLLALG